jgi:hypothetical protein
VKNCTQSIVEAQIYAASVPGLISRKIPDKQSFNKDQSSCIQRAPPPRSHAKLARVPITGRIRKANRAHDHTRPEWPHQSIMSIADREKPAKA